MPPPKNGSDIYVARETGAVEVDGSPTIIYKGVTRVRQGHELLRKYPGMFEPINLSVHYEVEQATAGPGERRGE